MVLLVLTTMGEGDTAIRLVAKQEQRRGGQSKRRGESRRRSGTARNLHPTLAC